MSNEVINIIAISIQLIVAIAFFLIGKYVPQAKIQLATAKAQEITTTLTEWAKRFVQWAQEYKAAEKGEERMQYVVDELTKIAEQKKWNITEEQLKAITQEAYNITIGSKKDNDNK